MALQLRWSKSLLFTGKLRQIEASSHRLYINTKMLQTNLPPLVRQQSHIQKDTPKTQLQKLIKSVVLAFLNKTSSHKSNFKYTFPSIKDILPKAIPLKALLKLIILKANLQEVIQAYVSTCY